MGMKIQREDLLAELRSLHASLGRPPTQKDMGKCGNYHGDVKHDKCYFCQCSGSLEEHHIIPQRFGGPDHRRNIVELCELCHKRIERLYDKSFYEWFGIEDEQGQRRFHQQCKNKGCKNVAKVLLDRSVFRSWGGSATLYCRPCALQKIDDVYHSKLGQYRHKRRNLHERAREFHKEGSVPEYAVMNSARKLNQIGTPSKDELLQEAVLEEEGDVLLEP